MLQSYLLIPLKALSLTIYWKLDCQNHKHYFWNQTVVGRSVRTTVGLWLGGSSASASNFQQSCFHWIISNSVISRIRKQSKHSNKLSCLFTNFQAEFRISLKWCAIPWLFHDLEKKSVFPFFWQPCGVINFCLIIFFLKTVQRGEKSRTLD